jgi:hypothetical protein
MLDGFWKEFFHSDLVTPVAKEARTWFLREAPVLDEEASTIGNLSPFGNMVAQKNNDLRIERLVDTNFQLVQLMGLVKSSAYRYSYELRPNLIVSGDGGAGKSFAAIQNKAMSMPGSVSDMTHMTQHAMQTDGDMSDQCFLMEETPMAIFGLDPRTGKFGEADPFFKNRLTAQVSTTMQPVLIEGERRTRTYVNRIMASHICLSNEKKPPLSSPIMTRFLSYEARVEQRPACPRPALGSAGSTDARDSREAEADPRMLPYKVKDFGHFLWEKAIEADILPDVDMRTAHAVADLVFLELEQNGIPRPSARLERMYFDLCRVCTMLYGVHMVLCSELRTTEGKLTPAALMQFPKWGVCTEEIAVFVMTLLDFCWVPSIYADVAKAARKIDPTVGRDPNYAVCMGTSLTKVAEQLCDEIALRPSTRDMVSTLLRMSRMKLTVKVPRFDAQGKAIAVDEEIPCVRVESNSRDFTGTRVLVAKQLAATDARDQLLGAISTALQHKHRAQEKDVFLTGLAYRAEEEVGPPGSPEKQSTVYHHVLDVLEISRSQDREITLKNGRACSTVEHNIAARNPEVADAGGACGRDLPCSPTAAGRCPLDHLCSRKRIRAGLAFVAHARDGCRLGGPGNQAGPLRPDHCQAGEELPAGVGRGDRREQQRW